MLYILQQHCIKQAVFEQTTQRYDWRWCNKHRNI